MNDDLIRRSDAIKVAKEFWYKPDIAGALAELPAIEPKTKVIAQITFDEEKLREIVKKAVERFKEEYEIEPKRGEWINKIVDDVKITVCSNCNKEPTFTHYYGSCGNYSLSDFCPNCGSKMRGEHDD